MLYDRYYSFAAIALGPGSGSIGVRGAGHAQLWGGLRRALNDSSLRV